MRTIEDVRDAPAPHWVGDGFPVRSLFHPGSDAAELSPFLLLDHAVPFAFEPSDSPRGVDVHPHRGFETVTIVYQGALEHRDSTGNSGHIGPGDVQWMTAGSGILHEEYHSAAFTKSGGTLEMVQLWVNLPAEHKMTSPGYQTLLDRDIPSVALPDDAGSVRVIAGSFAGRNGPARTFTPVDIWDVALKPGKHASLDGPDGHTLALMVLKGVIEVNGTEIVREGQLVRFARTAGPVSVEANNDVRLLVLGGAPIDEPVVSHGPFVMNTPEQIRAAVQDYRNGAFGAMSARG
ncbi:MAG: pirin family protein [Hyphomicrobium sp.]